jgi:ATP-dependent DNA helicase DinG
MVWALLTAENAAATPPTAKWISAALVRASANNKQQSIEYTLCASPVQVSDLLAERFWRHAAGVILTSATLRSLGKFDMLLNDTGLRAFAKTTCIALESPFDFAKQGQLIIPPMQSDPSNPYAHTQEIIALLPQLIPTSGANGALVLFSSRKQMLAVAEKLPAALKNLLLIQGDQAREIILQKHFARIANNEASILFGLDSFAEGLDLPGNACNKLIIAKLPFAIPDDPVSETFSEWLSAQGKNPFMELALPRASIKLIQAVGRLIRSETDTGTVIILDKRIITKRYGELLRKSLPPFRRVK